MSDSQCKVFDPCSGHCQCGDMGCPDDTNPAPPGDHMKISDFEEHSNTRKSRKTFPGKACAAPIGFEKNHIHWTCLNTGISTGEIPNPYRFYLQRKVTSILSTLTVLPPRSYLLPLCVPQFLSKFFWIYCLTFRYSFTLFSCPVQLNRCPCHSLIN